MSFRKGGAVSPHESFRKGKAVSFSVPPTQSEATRRQITTMISSNPAAHFPSRFAATLPEQTPVAASTRLGPWIGLSRVVLSPEIPRAKNPNPGIAAYRQIHSGAGSRPGPRTGRSALPKRSPAGIDAIASRREGGAGTAAF